MLYIFLCCHSDWPMFIREVFNTRTTISIYRQLGKWIETVDAAYATAHSELLATISTPSSNRTPESEPDIEETPPPVPKTRKNSP
ncbi:hypothetical protein EV702DRAFT_1199041 [Suillus placidus]|uniref:Uncharacterized protein n=1 Tax=Suillus placidus TaxID=48579 RepID=A0A9P6ZS96_9AGAM|nr:hypothetical protein EV702DRAFT_1199041 [Suillus placidus]